MRRKITAVGSVWVEQSGLNVVNAYVVATMWKDGATTWVTGRCFDGAFHLQYFFDTLAQAEQNLREMARAEGTALLQCKGSIETILSYHALSFPWKESQ